MTGSQGLASRYWVWILLFLPWQLNSCGKGEKAPFILEEGKGWQGKLSLGDPEKKVVRSMGKPHRQQLEGNWKYFDYTVSEITIDGKSDEVASILLRQDWRTSSGISEGDSAERIQQIYGFIDHHPPILSYPQRGISFVLVPRGLIDSDGTKRPGWVAVWARIRKPQP